MKTKLILLALTVSTLGNAQFLTEDKPLISVWIDPAGSINEGGAHVGVDLQMIMHGGWAAISVSNFSALKDGYTDLIGSGGLNFNLFNYDALRYYAGGRIGVAFRGGNPYPIAGGVIGFDFHLKELSKALDGIYIGGRGWTDYRSDQHNHFYGDSDGYKRGLVTNNPMLQENGAIVVTFSF